MGIPARLDVAVQDPDGVEVVEPLRDLDEHVPHLVLREARPAGEGPARCGCRERAEEAKTSFELTPTVEPGARQHDGTAAGVMGGRSSRFARLACCARSTPAWAMTMSRLSASTRLSRCRTTFGWSAAASSLLSFSDSALSSGDRPARGTCLMTTSAPSLRQRARKTCHNQKREIALSRSLIPHKDG